MARKTQPKYPPNRALRALREVDWDHSRADFAAAIADKAAELGMPELGVDARLVARWEDGDCRPGPRYRRVLVALTGRSEAELGIGRVPSERRVGRATVPEVDRRQFVASGLTALVPVAPLPPRPAPVDPALIDYFHEQLSGHYRADMMLGPRALIDTVAAQFNLLNQLMDDAEDDVRRRLANVASAYASFSGWLFLDAGDATSALRWHSVALEFGHRAGNSATVACSLIDRAMAHTDLGAGRAVVDLCLAALKTDRLPPELAVFALQQHAHGSALLGERSEVDQLLDLAARQIRRVEVEEWGTACLRNPLYIEVQRATCYGRLGAAKEADTLWAQIIPASSTASRRDVGVWTARHARAKAAQRQPEAAVNLAQVATRIAIETGSARARRELVNLDRDMSPWHDATVGRHMAEILAPMSEGA